MIGRVKKYFNGQIIESRRLNLLYSCRDGEVFPPGSRDVPFRVDVSEIIGSVSATAYRHPVRGLFADIMKIAGLRRIAPLDRFFVVENREGIVEKFLGASRVIGRHLSEKQVQDVFSETINPLRFGEGVSASNHGVSFTFSNGDGPASTCTFDEDEPLRSASREKKRPRRDIVYS